ncbi:MAG: 5'/3'-nucleotidase SurE [Candidatus Krumholzibacteriota bacterium]|nr:5'/3'-nucleotidase SurE [Candidatus Krumholzibacteriota bacterium]
MKDNINILVTNDDGIRASGLRALVDILSSIGNVIVIAPEVERSASSHSITLNKPLRVHEYGNSWFSVTGSPADCVIMAVYGIMDSKPDIVVSGINHGPNMGEDVIYSGTVAAAIEGYILGINSIAISVTSRKNRDFTVASSVSGMLVRKMIQKTIDDKLLLNVNIPYIGEDKFKGIKITSLGSRVYNDMIIAKKDPRGDNYYWIGGGKPGWRDEDKTDFQAVKSGFVSVTPISISMTDKERIPELESWDWGSF